MATTICLTWSTYISNGWTVKMILLLNSKYMNNFDIRATYFLLFDISGLSQIIQPKCNCIDAREKNKVKDLPIQKSSDLWLHTVKKTSNSLLKTNNRFCPPQEQEDGKHWVHEQTPQTQWLHLSFHQKDQIPSKKGYPLNELIESEICSFFFLAESQIISLIWI